MTDTLAWFQAKRARPQVDLLLLDLHLPGLDGLSIVDELVKHDHPPRVLLFSGKIDAYSLWRSRQAPVHGFIAKPEEGLAVAVRALLHIATGGRYYSPSIQAAIARTMQNPSSWWQKLTRREIELMPHFGRGGNDITIGESLGLSDKTIRTHRGNILRRMGLPSSAALVAFAHEQGFVRDTALGLAREIG